MILLLLKERTKAYHDSIDRSMNIFNREMSIEDYRGILERFWGFYFPVETQLRAIGGRLLPAGDFEKRYKLPLLASDLRVLGMDDVARNLLPICEDVPRLDTLSQVLGCMYVLEGATLGGQIIARRMSQVLALDATQGCSFFSSYRHEVGAMWKAFCHLLTGYASDAIIEETIIDAACETFEKFNRWFVERELACVNNYSYKQSI